MTNSDNILAHTLSVLNKEFKGVVPKIVLQRFIYFLNSQGVTTWLKFEPGNYGPYSYDLSKKIHAMSKDKSLIDLETNIMITNLDSLGKLNADRLEEIKIHFDNFKSITKDMSFKDLDIFGIALYSALALSFQNFELTPENILAEFKGWRGNKYQDCEILNCIELLDPFLPSNQ